jgi:hypothetical protein
LRELSDPQRLAIMTRLWQRMRELLGQSWVRAYGEADGQTPHAWAGALGDFTPTEIGGAIQAVQDWDSAFPPTFPEFKALCLSVRAKQRPNWTQERVAREVPLQQLTAPQPGDSETARQEKAMIRQIMAGEDVESRQESYDRLHLARRWGKL